MKRAFPLLLSLLFLCLPSAAQYRPKTIQFKGAPEYTTQELMAAANLRKGMALTSGDMKAHLQILTDTGAFEKLSFKFDGEDLVFLLQLSTSLCPIRLENLPLTSGKELDTMLQSRVPLYRGKVPTEGTLLDDVRTALEGILAAQGMKATLTVMPFTNTKGTEMSFSITTPFVQVGEIHLDAASAPDSKTDPKVAEILAKLAGSSYSIEGTPNLIATNLGNYYREKGYLQAEIHSESLPSPVITPEAISIPFQVSISPGTLYKLSTVRLAPDLLVSQTDFDRQSGIHVGDVADGKHVRENWLYIERQYHNKGYMKASVHPLPTFDRNSGTVSYAVAVDPGPVYKMGTLTMQNVSDDLRSLMLAAWTMPAGAVFNEGAILQYVDVHGGNPTLGRVFAAVDFSYTTNLNDDTHTADLVIRLTKKNQKNP